MPPSLALKGYRFPRLAIGYPVGAYCRFALSLQDVEDFLAGRGRTVSHEATRNWVAKFGAQIASKFLRDRPQSADNRH